MDAIVIDNGSQTFRAGLCSERYPRVEVPSFVRESKQVNEEGERSVMLSFVGPRRSNYNTIYPVTRGVITDWNAIEKLWGYAFEKLGNNQQVELPVLLTESPVNSRENREKMAEIIFEKFNIPSLHWSPAKLNWH
jgi:actin-related protein